MASEWKKISLREAGVSLIDCVHKTPPASVTGYPYVAIPQLKNGRLDLSDVRLISPEHFAEWTRKANPQPYDVILSRRCNPGETALVPPGFQGALGQNLVLLRADGEKVFPPFLRWLVRSPDWWEQVGTFINVGAIFDSLKCADIPNFRLPIPPLDEQKAIAHILVTLDDKIELNQQMNQTLESIARALFKSWFIDFDPVRARMDGRQPAGMDAETAALFPDEFEDSAIGQIPKGWQIVDLSSLIELMNGGTPKTSVSDYWGGDIFWYAVTDSPNSTDIFVIDTAKKITQIGLENSTTRLLPTGTTIISARGTVGKCALTAFPIAMNQTCYGIKGKEGRGDYWTYFIITNAILNLKQSSHGTVFDAISRDTFKQIFVSSPPLEVIHKFDNLASSLLIQILNNLYKSQTLISIRDALLPKLLSSEIYVKDAEKILEAVA